MRPLHRQATLEQLLPGASEMAARMRAFDWSSTGLGSPEQWPQSLKTSVRILLTARQPMVVWWGERFITLYNDSCARFLPANHPAALGEPASAVWPELWAQIGAHAASVRHGNEGAYDEALPIIGICNGCPQEIYVTLSYSPLPNDDGSSGGVFCSLNEETQRILGERQESLLRTLAASIATAQTKQEVCTLAASAIKSNPHDLPFALFYLRDPQNRSAVLAGRVGLAPDAKSAPQSVALAAASDWPVGEVIRTRQATLLSELTGLAAELPRMRGYAVRQAFTLPIALPGAQDALGVLVVGLNPLRLWGDGYRRFLEQVAAQVAQALVSAVDIPAHKRAEQELLRLKDELAQRATDKYLALFNAIDEGFAIIELLYDANGRPFDFRILEVNPAPEKMSGLQVHVGQTARQHVPDLEDFWIETLSAVAATGESVRFERYSHAVGCWFTVFAAKIGGQESRQVAVIFQDISAHKRREANLAFLAEISEVASRLSSYREMMYTVAAKIGAFLELSACGLSEIDESQERFVQTYGWQGGESPQVTSTNDRLAGCLSEGLLRAARAGEIAIIGNIAHDPRTSAQTQAAPTSGALVSVPFHRSGQWKYLLSVFASHPRQWREDEIDLLRKLANRIFSRLERARTEAALRKSEEWQAFLLKLSDALRLLADPRAIQEVATRLLGQHLGANRVLYGELADDGLELVIEQNYITEGQPLVVGHFPVNQLGTALVTALTTRRSLILPECASAAELSEGERRVYAAFGIAALLAVPLVKDRRMVAVLAVHQASPRAWTAEEVALVQETAERIWVAVERARAKAALADDLRDTQLLHHLSTRSVSEGSMPTLYQEVVAAAIALTQADAGTVQILDEKAQQLLLLASHGFERAMVEHFNRVDASSNTSCGLALASGERTFVDFDAPDSPDPDGSLRLQLEAGYRSAQSTCLIARSGRPIGMVSTHWRSHHRPSERELRFLDLLARQAADLIEQMQAQEALQRSRDELELRVRERTAQLQELNNTRQKLLQRLVTVQEDERRRIARELHDTLGQFLSALNLRLSLLQQVAGAPPAIVAEIAQLRPMVNQIEFGLDRLTMELRPPTLDDFGLPEALRNYATVWSRTTQIPVDVYAAGFDQQHLSPVIENALYRIVQEALTNVLRHAQASAVSVILERRRAALQLIIEDNGIGFDPEAITNQGVGRRRLGLVGMQERAMLVGGSLEIESAPGAGTTLYVHIPLPSAPEEANQ